MRHLLCYLVAFIMGLILGIVDDLSKFQMTSITLLVFILAEIYFISNDLKESKKEFREIKSMIKGGIER